MRCTRGVKSWLGLSSEEESLCGRSRCVSSYSGGTDEQRGAGAVCYGSHEFERPQPCALFGLKAASIARTAFHFRGVVISFCFCFLLRSVGIARFSWKPDS